MTLEKAMEYADHLLRNCEFAMRNKHGQYKDAKELYDWLKPVYDYCIRQKSKELMQ